MAEPWDVFCNELMDCSTPPTPDNELHDAVAILESQLQSASASATCGRLDNRNDEQLPNLDPVTTTEDDLPPNDLLELQRPKVRYVTMIRDALLASDTSLTVGEIYQFIMDKYPFYQANNRLHWKNSVRHNLAAYDGKLFKGIKHPRDGKESAKSPISWTLTENWKEVEARITNHTTPETLLARRKKKIAMESSKDGKKLKVFAGKRQKVTIRQNKLPKLAPKTDDKVGVNLHTLQLEPIDLRCSKSPTKGKCKKNRMSGRKRNFSGSLKGSTYSCKPVGNTPTETDTQRRRSRSLSSIGPDNVDHLQPQDKGSTPTKASMRSLDDIHAADAAPVQRDHSQISQSPTNPKFVFFDCQGVSCLGIPTPPSSVGSNISSAGIDETSPGPVTPELVVSSIELENTTEQVQSVTTKPLSHTKSSYSQGPLPGLEFSMPSAVSPLESTRSSLQSPMPHPMTSPDLSKPQPVTQPESIVTGPGPPSGSLEVNSPSVLPFELVNQVVSSTSNVTTDSEPVTSRHPPKPITSPDDLASRDKVSKKHFAVVPTKPTSAPMPTQSLVTPRIPNSATGIMRPLGSSAGRSAFSIITPCLSRTALETLRLASPVQTQSFPYPVTMNLPEITVNDICKTLECDDWSINLELHPGFSTGILQGFEYDAHCQRPLASEKGFSLQDSSDFCGLLQPDATFVSEESLATFPTEEFSSTLPPDAICPPCMMDDDILLQTT